MTIFVRLYGGLGNQMFQYALARHLSLLNHTILKLDVGYFEDQILRRYSLSCFNILQQFATTDEINAFFPVSPKLDLPQRLQRKLQRMTSSGNSNLANSPSARIVCREAHYHFDPDVLNLRGDIYLDGYWQTERYFLPTQDLVRKEFTVRYPLDDKNQNLAEKIQKSTSVAIHIRRGDYITNPSAYQAHGVCSPSYFQQAVDVLAERFENLELYLFSDEPGWVFENLKFSLPTTYITHNQACEFEDLRLMSLCQHQVISNSSFGWWAAWLNSNPNKIVIAPQRWFDHRDWNTCDLIPQNWIRL